MTLINLKNLLNHAKQNKYAVGAFNVTSLDFIDHLLGAAISENSPIILQVAEVHFRYLNLEEIAPALISAAKKINIPVCIHLDHGKSLKTMIRAIRAGFTSIMYDCSEYPLEENIKRTKEVVKIAHSVEVSVEGELGNVGGEAVGIQAATPHEASEKFFTKIKDAEIFTKESQLDALAISIGNVHGLYKGEPKLDFNRLAQIKDIVDIPLVLHGGSGISDDDFKKAISLGISKINFYTTISQVAIKKVHEFITQYHNSISYPDLVKVAMEEVRKKVREMLRVFGSANQCAPDKTLCISCSKNSCEINCTKSRREDRTFHYQDLVEKISQEVLHNLKN